MLANGALHATPKGENTFMEVEAIRDVKKIEAMKRILRGSPGGLRDEALFVMGINSALRISDMLALTLGDVLGDRGKLLDAIELKEQKTGKVKRFPINKSIREALAVYLKERGVFDHAGDPDRLAPLFLSRKGGALSRWRARRILSDAGEAVGLDSIGTHSLRKTFGYHVYKRSGGNLGLVQKLLNHSSSGDTLRYIGIDREQMDDAYLELNL